MGNNSVMPNNSSRKLLGPYPLRSTNVGAHSICARHEEKRQSNGRSKPLPYQESNTVCPPYLPLVVAKWREIHFKILCLSPLLPLKSGTDRGDPRGNVLASFLATSWDAPRSGIKKRHSSARGVPRSMSVPRRSRIEFTQTKIISPERNHHYVQHRYLKI